MTQHNLPETISLLSRTPAALNALLRDVSETWTLRNEGEGTWTPFDVVGHLIYGERADWMPRARMILEFGDSRTFEAFDMSGHIQVCREKSLGELLDEFSQLRAANLADLKALHLLASWPAHDLTHLHQISRIMRTNTGMRWDLGPSIWASCGVLGIALFDQRAGTGRYFLFRHRLVETGPTADCRLKPSGVAVRIPRALRGRRS
jgi:hypothetical protein